MGFPEYSTPSGPLAVCQLTLATLAAMTELVRRPVPELALLHLDLRDGLRVALTSALLGVLPRP